MRSHGAARLHEPAGGPPRRSRQQCPNGLPPCGRLACVPHVPAVASWRRAAAGRPPSGAAPAAPVPYGRPARRSSVGRRGPPVAGRRSTS
eukprot:7029914-Alexandrium_andersonii.AAC.1